MSEMNQKNPGSFTPRTSGNKKRKINKDGLLALLFVVLVAIIVVVLVVFLVRAIVGGNENPDVTLPPDSNTQEPTGGQTPNIPTADYSTVSVSYSEMKNGSLILVNDQNLFTGNTDDIVSLYNQPGFKTAFRLKSASIGLKEDVIDEFSSLMISMRQAFAGSLNANDFYLIQRAASSKDAPADRSNEECAGYTFYIRVTLANGKTRRLNDAEQTWLANYCANYGFVLRYAEDKVAETGNDADLYTFRYVGIPHSTYMYENNLCLEEYLEEIKNYSYSSPLEVTSGAKQYEIYYVKADGISTEIKVPLNSTYEISGNNYNGYIVTITK